MPKRLFMQGIAAGTVVDTTPTEIAGPSDTAPNAAAGSPVIRINPDGVTREMEIAAAATIQTARWNDMSYNNWGLQAWFRFTGTMTATTTVLSEFRHTTSSILARWTIGTDHLISLQDTAGAFETKQPTTAPDGSAGGLSTDGSRNRIAMWKGSVANTISLRCYDGTGKLVWSLTDRDIGAFGPLAWWIWGKTGATAGGPVLWSGLEVIEESREVGLVATSDATLSFDQSTGVEPGQSITATLGGGTTTAFTQTGGAAALAITGTGNTRTIIAPPTLTGTTMTFSHTVSGDATPATASVVVVPSARRMKFDEGIRPTYRVIK